MKQFRSASQILFGFLPEQTVDLEGKVWKITQWRRPLHRHIDDTALRQELLRLAAPWELRGTDNGYCQQLRQGWPIVVQSLDRNNGVTAESFPNTWKCKQCSRLHTTFVAQCQCGSRRVGQLPFVGFHDCGALFEPSIPRCANHQQVMVILPGTSSAREISFVCPVCNRFLQQGFGFSRCRCGGSGQIQYNVHRASAVYTPRSVVLVNPPSPDRVRRLAEAGGETRALSWALDGCSTKRYDEVEATRDSLAQDLIARGLPSDLVGRIVRQAEEEGALAPDRGLGALADDRRREAGRAAVTLAMALDVSRTRIAELSTRADGQWSELAKLYKHTYPSEIARAGLDAIELIDRFPILTGNYAYTRGDASPGNAYLKPFAENRRYVVYADVAETEALLVKLQPSLVATWIEQRGIELPRWTDERSARLSILSAIDIPVPGSASASTPTVGEMMLRLVHSYSHRFIRRASVFAGIDRNALSELLIPHHLSFIVYAASRGDFVLGGLQAVFESELHNLLREVVLGDHRCALDPGCNHAGGACMACLHIGEPSCRYYNQYLDRRTLFGATGYLRLAGEPRGAFVDSMVTTQG